MRRLSFLCLLLIWSACSGGDDSPDSKTSDSGPGTDTPTSPTGLATAETSDSASDIDCEAMGDLTVEIGTGEVEFVPLNEGDEVIIVHGPQGGWHISVGARVSNAYPELTSEPSVYVPSVKLQFAGDQQPFVFEMDPARCDCSYDAETCSGTYWGGMARAYMDDQTPFGQREACRLDGAGVELTLTVTETRTGRTVTETLSAVARIDPMDDCS